MEIIQIIFVLIIFVPWAICSIVILYLKATDKNEYDPSTPIKMRPDPEPEPGPVDSRVVAYLNGELSMEDRIEYLESLLPNDKLLLKEKHREMFVFYTTRLSKQVLQCRKYFSGNKEELFLMYILDQEGIEFAYKR